MLVDPVRLLLALQVLDIISTVLALRRPGTVEANPLLAPLFARFGALPTLLVVKSAVCALLWQYQADLPLWLLLPLCAGYAYVVVNNFVIVLRADK
jgi:hypothetical protein